MKNERPATLGELRASGYTPRSVKEELRANLIGRIRAGTPLFAGIHGYDHTVIPALERAVLAGHSINLLGLRGQAKTRMARSLVQLLDEWVPVVEGSEINDDPLRPISRASQEHIAREKDATPIIWLHRDQRYTEKLATPDVTVADLIGDSDPIKAANLRLDQSDERVIHFGLIPRSHRGIFVINELPDLQPRIQVALFNILQEGDVQVRGFKLRLPLDIQFVFTANPEDYTNRGAIITPLKDRIQSQILTHYPATVQEGMTITAQEIRGAPERTANVSIPELIRELVERIAVEARKSEYVDQRSGVSARSTISALEVVVSAAERRMLRTGEERTTVRIGDLITMGQAIIGKIELVYEGEQEGPEKVANHLLSLAIRNAFSDKFPDPGKLKRKDGKPDPYARIVSHFDQAHVDLLQEAAGSLYHDTIHSVPGLVEFVKAGHPKVNEDELDLWAEFVLHGLAEHSRIGKSLVMGAVQFSDLFDTMFTGDVNEDHDGVF